LQWPDAAVCLSVCLPDTAVCLSACRTGTAAILAVAASKPTVTVDGNGRIGVEKQMRVNLTCDHRIIYGADAAEFMLTLKGIIEDPDQLTF
jgi:pyruvate dehydrogenase E2 component (dihydrolipoamide acetyltransferase)